MKREEHVTNRASERVPEDPRVPYNVRWEIRDLVQPIILRRSALFRAGAVLAVLGVLAAAMWVLVLRPPTGDRLVSEMIRAAGGMEQWYGLEEGSFTRVRTLYDEREEPIRTVEETYYFRKGPRGMGLAIESRGEHGHVIIGRDEEGYWALQDGNVVPAVSAARPLGMMCDSDTCAPLCASEMAFYRFSFPFKLADPGVIRTYAGTTELNRVPVHLLDITFEPDVGRDRWVFYVDRDTKLIRKVEHYPSATGDTPPQEIYWADLREEGGITLSHRNTYYRSNGTKLEEYTITEVRFNEPVPDAMFTRPESPGQVAAL